MNWAAALFTISVWMLAASIWQLYRPMPRTASHQSAILRVLQDIAPAILLGVLMARII